MYFNSPKGFWKCQAEHYQDIHLEPGAEERISRGLDEHEVEDGC